MTDLTSAGMVLLPGLDGTARLFNRFLAAAPADCTVIPFALPAEPLTYPELAAQRPVSAVVFANSFVSAPRCRGLRRAITPALFQISPPRFFCGATWLDRLQTMRSFAN